jgi:hypothetical protein
MKEMSFLKTSALVDEESVVFIRKLKRRVGKKKFSEIMNKIFMDIVMKYANKNSPVVRDTVKYQKKKSNLRLFHYSIDSNIYEACLDVRNFNKVSVSFIINEAIRELIYESVSKLSIIKCGDYYLQFIFTINKMDSYQILYSVSLYYDGKSLIQRAKTEIQKK